MMKDLKVEIAPIKSHDLKIKIELKEQCKVVMKTNRAVLKLINHLRDQVVY